MKKQYYFLMLFFMSLGISQAHATWFFPSYGYGDADITWSNEYIGNYVITRPGIYRIEGEVTGNILINLIRRGEVIIEGIGQNPVLQGMQYDLQSLSPYGHYCDNTSDDHSWGYCGLESAHIIGRINKDRSVTIRNFTLKNAGQKALLLRGSGAKLIENVIFQAHTRTIDGLEIAGADAVDAGKNSIVKNSFLLTDKEALSLTAAGSSAANTAISLYGSGSGIQLGSTDGFLPDFSFSDPHCSIFAALCYLFSAAGSTSLEQCLDYIATKYNCQRQHGSKSADAITVNGSLATDDSELPNNDNNTDLSVIGGYFNKDNGNISLTNLKIGGTDYARLIKIVADGVVLDGIHIQGELLDGLQNHVTDAGQTWYAISLVAKNGGAIKNATIDLGNLAADPQFHFIEGDVDVAFATGPAVAITSPLNGDEFAAGSAVEITAEASDLDGTIEQVEFTANGEVIGTVTESPYMAMIDSLAEGQTKITATATDNDARQASASINIQTPPVEPEDIDDLVATNPVCGTIVLTWSDVPAADAYRVRRKIVGAATFTNLNDVGVGVQIYVDNTVQPDVEYEYMVRPMINGKAVKVSNRPVIKNDCGGGSGSSSSGGPVFQELPNNGSAKTALNSYVETNGLVIMEIENTESDLDLWIPKTDVDQYRGSGHFEFTGNNQSSGPPKSPLSFNFKINEGGLYGLSMRARKRLDGAESDKSNDAYVRVEGDYGDHPDAGDSHNKPARLWDLQRDVKLFGGLANAWGFTATLDLGGHDNKRQPYYDFVSGESYKLTVSGRSKNFNIDRIVFHKLSEYARGGLDEATLNLSETVADGSIAQPSPNREPSYVCPSFDTVPLWEDKGRIAISSDGNEHDKDDWAATPLSLALLASQGLQDNLAVYTYSDHIWGSNHDHADATAQMRESAETGKMMFNFSNSNFVEAVANPPLAFSSLAVEINKSSEDNPLFILAAGPMEVVGQAIAISDPSKLPFVTLVSHSNWNNNHADRPKGWESHSGWTLGEINANFGPLGLTILKILDQNGGDGYDGLRAHTFKFNWLENSGLAEWDWLLSRLEAARKGVDYDPSDAGMVVYLLTGNEKTDPCHARDLMQNPK